MTLNCLPLIRHLNLENGVSSLGQSLPLLKLFFRSHVNPSLLRSCNLNGCYWIHFQTLGAFLVKCVNLEGLHVAETNLSIRHIVTGILRKCSKVTKLSFTLKIGDWISCAKHLSNHKQPALCRLKSVEIVVQDSKDRKSQLYETMLFLRYNDFIERSKGQSQIIFLNIIVISGAVRKWKRLWFVNFASPERTG